MCDVSVCGCCWHRLSHQRCLCSSEFAGGGLYRDDDKFLRRPLKYWRRGD